ncbi:CpcT/CpeT family chromophore lyase [Gloeocapsopsis dulcis]|uniref:CpcT/CpeT family chromophore lyase n=1 Tax=Gloeocapsopsis dulcis TaxID=2859516 RepID=UPI001F35BEFD|nr:CpcT/CpeT family chromophore lyase [Gloeocapsopsis dulcis]WNN88729.1 CpcT/CpeT family chromophore lyase [Gloeocapsopsis dulcis]
MCSRVRSLSVSAVVSKKRISILVSIAVLTCVSAVNAAPANNLSSPAQQVQEVVSHLDGAMDTSAQALANPNAPNVRITTCKVTVKDAALTRPHAVFMYQEQALSQRLSQPYRQRFLRIAPSVDNNSVESAVFRPPTAKAWIG